MTKVAFCYERRIAPMTMPDSDAMTVDRVPLTSSSNISLHYSEDKTLSLDPEALFEKFVHRGIAGYCMEQNTFFYTVLRSLGYDLYITGARVSNSVGGGKDPDPTG